MKRFYWIIFSLLLFFVLTNEAKASDVFDNAQLVESSTLTMGTHIYNPWTINATSTSGYISGFYLKMNRFRTCDNSVSFRICSDSHCVTPLATKTLTQQECIDQIPLTNTAFKVDFGQTLFIGTSTVYLSFDHRPALQNTFRFLGSNPAVYGFVMEGKNSLDNWVSHNYSVYYQIFFYPQTISLENPNTTDIYKNFQYFQIKYFYEPSSWPSTLTVKIDYGTSSTNMAYSETEAVPDNRLWTGWEVVKTKTLGDGFYYWQGSFYDNGNLVATTSVQSFTINNTSGLGTFTGYNNYNPIATTSLTELSVSCDPDSGVFSFSLCSLFYFLFVPSDSAVQSFMSVKDTLMTKSPFSYLSQAKDSIDSISLSSTTPPQLDLSFDMGQGSTTFSMLNFKTTDDMFGSGTRLIFYNFVKYLIYLVYLFYLYHRITAIFATQHD